MQPPITLTARRPRSIWNAPVESDFGDILASVGKGAAEALLGGPAGVAAAAVDLLRVVRVTKDAGELAWLLVARALGRAIRDAYDSFAGDEAEAGEVEAFVKAVHLFIGERSWPLTPRFFEDPSSVPVVAEVADIFARWLLGRGAAAAEVVAARGEVIVGFAAAISAEWRDEPATYEAIAKALQQPFSLADWTSGLWRGYHDSLRREPDAPLFDEPFTLRDIYIPLRGATRIDANKPPVIRSAADTLHDWLNGSSWRDVLRVVSGGPGSGKSSFMKMFADAAVARNDFAVLFVPLHLFDFNGSLEASLREFARSCGAPPDPLATATRPLLLIFDGLDELEMQGAHGAAVASAFLGDLWKMLGRRNRSERRVFAIVTGREILLQTVEHMVDAATVVTLLPFLVDDPKAYGDPEELGRLDQREEWWKRYGQLTGRGYGGLPAPLAGRELDELTAQPLLTYAVATAYAAGKLRLEGNVNQNSVYGDLLAAVYERRWASGQHPAARTITTLAAFERVLQEIAAAAWSGNRRSTTVGDIRDRAKRCGHSIPLSAFEAAEEEGLTRFLTAFYFRYRSSTDEPQRTFEFTHKSFSEYLTARWIVAALEELSTHDRGAAAVDFITLFGDLP
ncbi:MAG TPA: NACHT domain-containing protein, partial [Thermoanaerobaculia bacterium]